MKPVREATYEERATWGECPVCHAPDGQWCSPEGTQRVHLGRLMNAPLYVRLVPALKPEPEPANVT